jgi:hypothetical protein
VETYSDGARVPYGWNEVGIEQVAAHLYLLHEGATVAATAGAQADALTQAVRPPRKR